MPPPPPLARVGRTPVYGRLGAADIPLVGTSVCRLSSAPPLPLRGPAQSSRPSGERGVYGEQAVPKSEVPESPTYAFYAAGTKRPRGQRRFRS